MTIKTMFGRYDNRCSFYTHKSKIRTFCNVFEIKALDLGDIWLAWELLSRLPACALVLGT